MKKILILKNGKENQLENMIKELLLIKENVIIINEIRKEFYVNYKLESYNDNLLFDVINNDYYKNYYLIHVTNNIQNIEYDIVYLIDYLVDFNKLKFKKIIFSSSKKNYHKIWINLIDRDYKYISKNDFKIINSIYPSIIYKKKFIDLNVAGLIEAIYALMAIEIIDYFDINIKSRIIKKALENIFFNYYLERLYLNPTIYISTIESELDIELIYDFLKLFKKNIRIYSDIDDLKIVNYDLINLKHINENNIAEILNYKNDLVIFLGSFDFLKEVRAFFRKS